MTLSPEAKELITAASPDDAALAGDQARVRAALKARLAAGPAADARPPRGAPKLKLVIGSLLIGAVLIAAGARVFSAPALLVSNGATAAGPAPPVEPRAPA